MHAKTFSTKKVKRWTEGTAMLYVVIKSFLHHQLSYEDSLKIIFLLKRKYIQNLIKNYIILCTKFTNSNLFSIDYSNFHKKAINNIRKCFKGKIKYKVKKKNNKLKLKSFEWTNLGWKKCE